jgi:type 1 glutamine amidotransferase
MRSLALLLASAVAALAADAPAPLRVLVVTGGCCHDYATQHQLIGKGLEARANIKVTHAHSPSKGTDVTFDIYRGKEWWKDFDVIVHDECAADVRDKAYVANILAAHQAGVPAVNLHCAMHSYRWGNFGQPVKAGADNAGWFEFIGLQSTGHGPQLPIAITYTDTTHPVTVGLEGWTTIKEELYNNIAILGGKTLATGKQVVPQKDGKTKEVEAVVAWTNLYGPKQTRVFSTTLGHNNETVADARYLDFVTRAVLWSAGKLTDDGKPVAGYGPKTK